MSGQAEARMAQGIRGFVDGVTGNGIDGWAFEPAHPTERVVVELRLDGQTVATSVADRHRTDLVRAGVGDAFHGFRFPLKPAWAERRAELQVVARGAAGEETVLPLFRRGAPEAGAASPAAPSPQVMKAIEQLVAGQRALEGRLSDLALRVSAEPLPATLPHLPPAEPAEAEARLAALEGWVARLDERLAEIGAVPPAGAAPQARGLDTWQTVLLALLAVFGVGGLTALALALAL
ncbi:hypothetical protein [Falsiroseomonas sp. CW058]|uniref:hypothetical protein n=1 Tax=Falsiroseomonas sp. CW058 TaxID=3388664 RepID=UPI003D310D8A